MLVHFIMLDCKLWCLRLPLALELMLFTEGAWGRQCTPIALVVLVHSAKEIKWVNIWSEQLSRQVDKSMPLADQDEVYVVSLINSLIFWTLIDAFYFIVPIPCLQHTSSSLLHQLALLFLELGIPMEVWMPVGRWCEHKRIALQSWFENNWYVLLLYIINF